MGPSKARGTGYGQWSAATAPRGGENELGRGRGAASLAYFGIIALLVLIVVALAGGIIWYNLRKSTELMLAAAEREMVETSEKISDRIKLLYDPLYAIVGIASQVPEIKTPLSDTGHPPMAMLLRVLRFYPQILSLYVGLENGDFFGVTHMRGSPGRGFETRSKRRKTPPSRLRSSLPGKTGRGWNAGHFSTMTVSRLGATTTCLQNSTRGSGLGTDPHCMATTWRRTIFTSSS